MTTQQKLTAARNALLCFLVFGVLVGVGQCWGM